MASILILLGAPGAGKGTQAARLSAALSLPHVSTGDLFRENVSKETPIGKKAKGYMDAGELVPDEVVLDMLADRVSRPDCAQGYLLDGFPRTRPQAEALDARIGAQDDLAVLNLEVSDDTIVERAAGRLCCRTCTRTYHAKFSPPKVEGACDADGGELYRRKDDEPAVVQDRLREYHTKTAPLVAFYQDKGVLVNVDGEQSPDQVFQALQVALPTRS